MAVVRTLFEALTALLRRRSEKHIRALRSRLGFDGPAITLEDAGRLVKITRERVRQIEAKFLKDITNAPWSKDTFARIEHLLVNRQRPLTLVEAAQQDAWFDGMPPLPEVMATIMPSLSMGLFQVLTVEENLAVICSARVPPWSDVMTECRRVAERLKLGEATREEVNISIRQTLAVYGGSELAEIVVAELSESCHFSETNVLVGFGVSQKRLVEAILRASDRPLHYTEVAAKWSSREGEVIDPLRAHRALTRASAAHMFGRGTYGVIGHIRLARDTVDPIVHDCEFIMANSAVAKQKQWHTSDLITILENLRGDLPEEIDKYSLSVFLRNSELLEYVGQLVWRLRDSSSVPDELLDVRDLAIEVLVGAGHPLPELALRAAITRSRGLNRAYFRLEPTRILARVAPAVWGLVDRDFSIDETAALPLVDAVHDSLTNRGSALHSSELRGSLRSDFELATEVTGYMIQQFVAARDVRFKIFRGEMIGLASWRESRRLTLRGAMQQLVETLESDVTLDWIHEHLQRLTERQISRVGLSSIVARSDLEYDPDRKKWRKPENAEAVDPFE